MEFSRFGEAGRDCNVRLISIGLLPIVFAHCDRRFRALNEVVDILQDLCTHAKLLLDGTWVSEAHKDQVEQLVHNTEWLRRWEYYIEKQHKHVFAPLSWGITTLLNTRYQYTTMLAHAALSCLEEIFQSKQTTDDLARMVKKYANERGFREVTYKELVNATCDDEEARRMLLMPNMSEAETAPTSAPKRGRGRPRGTTKGRNQHSDRTPAGTTVRASRDNTQSGFDSRDESDANAAASQWDMDDADSQLAETADAFVVPTNGGLGNMLGAATRQHAPKRKRDSDDTEDGAPSEPPIKRQRTATVPVLPVVVVPQAPVSVLPLGDASQPNSS